MNNTSRTFSLGQVLATPAALAALESAGQTPREFLERHHRGDWGEVDPEDAALNDRALLAGSRLLSVYCTQAGQRVWIITEAEDEQGVRAATTLLLPQEY
jgi:hypothetical protein